MANLISGRNATLGIESDTTPGDYTTIGQMKDISVTGFAVTMFTMSARDRDFVRKYPAEIDPGQISFTLDFDASATPAGYTSGLLKYMTDKTEKNFQLTMNDSSTTQWVYPAYVMQFDLQIQERDGQTADVTLDISDSPILA